MCLDYTKTKFDILNFSDIGAKNFSMEEHNTTPVCYTQQEENRRSWDILDWWYRFCFCSVWTFQQVDTGLLQMQNWQPVCEVLFVGIGCQMYRYCSEFL